MPSPASVSTPQSSPVPYIHGETVVLGLDPSIAKTGYALLCGDRVLEAGKISTPASILEPLRLWMLFSEVLRLICEYRVGHIAIEQFQAFYRSKRSVVDEASFPTALSFAPRKRRGRHDRAEANPRSMFLMKAAQTATQLAGLLANVPVFLYPVKEWKGGSRVSKEEILDRVATYYNLKIRNTDAADAIWIAHHHIHYGRLRPGTGMIVSAQEREEVINLLCTSMASSSADGNQDLGSSPDS